MRWAGPIALAALLVAAPAVAQDDDDPVRAEARALAEEGVAAFQSDDYGLALTRLEGAYALVPLAAVRFNIALCLERLGRFREAAEHLEAVASSAELTPEQRAEASARATRLRSRLARLEIESTDGARITIAGRPCAVPCAEDVDPGIVVVTVEGPGGVRVEEVALQRSEHRRVVLEPPTLAPAGPTYEPQWIFWVGAGATVLGVAGIAGFGTWTLDLRSQFDRRPTTALADSGELARGVTNGAIGLAVAGAALIVLDVVLELTTSEDDAASE